MQKENVSKKKSIKGIIRAVIASAVCLLMPFTALSASAASNEFPDLEREGSISITFTYYDENTRAYQEQYGPASVRPAIKKTLEEADGYDIVLLGFPIWYGKAPRVVFSFLDSYSFKGKTVIPFITSGSTGISSAASELKSAYPDLGWKTGDRLNGKTSDQLKSWLESLGIKIK